MINLLLQISEGSVHCTESFLCAKVDLGDGVSGPFCGVSLYIALKFYRDF